MRNQPVFAVCFFAAILFTSTAFGATFYVDDDADGPYSGTLAAPFATIQDGIDAADYGDRVWVLTGTYDERIVLRNGVKLYAGPNVVIDGGDSGPVVTAIGVNRRTLLDGFTITNGEASDGAGMYIEDSELTVTYCTFERNHARSNGGGIFITDASPKITHCTFLNNSAINGGGIGMNFGANPEIEECLFESNSAVNDDVVRFAVAFGGGVHVGRDCRPVITECEFLENYAYPYGAGLSVVGSTAVVRRCVFDGNRTSNWGYGGGVYAYESDSRVWLFNSTFVQNRSLVGGGVCSKNGAQAYLINCTLYGNRATGSASAKGNAFYVGDGSEVGAYNSILWNNSTPQFSKGRLGKIYLTYSDVQGGYAGAGNIDAEPRFVNADAGNFHLRSDSPCIDTGINGWIRPEVDVDGDERIIDGDEDGTATSDMGIDEYNPNITIGPYIRWLHPPN